MLIYPKSLRQKILIGYIFLIAVLLLIIFVNASYLDKVEDMVMAGEKVADLFDATLEIRRFEKNYFLYRERKDYQELLDFVMRAEFILEGNRKELSSFAGEKDLTTLRHYLHEYKQLLSEIKDPEKLSIDNPVEESIRGLGKLIVTMTESVSASERIIMKETLAFSRRTLFLSFAVFIPVMFGASILFYSMFVRPMGMLERHMRRIADGDFSLLPIESKDREFISLDSAFNRMLVELESRKSQLVRSEKLASVGTLLFSVAHEINNPLSNISTSSQILKEEIATADIGFKKEMLDQIESETDRARDIVRSILDYSKSGTKETFNLKRAVEESIRFLKAELPPKITVPVSVPDDIRIYGDMQKIKQVFLNLIKNAAEAIKTEGEIRISARNVKEDVEIVVRDNGPGVEHGVLGKIFDPFFTTKEKRKGYGLGLFIVHNIIGEHDGKISVESETGHGTSFYITLPITKESGG